jgi:hypothetical protein
VPEDVRKQLQARGHKLRVTGAWSDGSLAAIVVDPKTGVLKRRHRPPDRSVRLGLVTY